MNMAFLLFGNLLFVPFNNLFLFCKTVPSQVLEFFVCLLYAVVSNFDLGAIGLAITVQCQIKFAVILLWT